MNAKILLVVVSLALSILIGLTLGRGSGTNVAPEASGKHGIVIGLSLDTLKEARWQADRDMFSKRAGELGARVLPFVPTTTRVFRRTERVAAYARIYQGGKTWARPVTLATRLLDQRDGAVVQQERTIPTEAFQSTPLAAEYRFDLPLSTLPEGEYLLELTVSAGGSESQRTVRFKVE